MSTPSRTIGLQQGSFYYDKQIKRFILQFMAVFSGLQVLKGKWNDENPELIECPIHYGVTDRVVASIIGDHTQNKPLRLPLLSAHIRSLTLATDRMHGVGLERRNTFTPVGGLVPNDTKVVHQRMPVPYDMEMEMILFTSNTEDQFQILEQILPLFDPQLNIRVSDAIFDWTRLSHIVLTEGPTLEMQYPIGAELRAIQCSMVFKMPVWIDTPADVRRDFIARVQMRIGLVNDLMASNEEIIADLDAQGIPYKLVLDAEQFVEITN